MVREASAESLFFPFALAVAVAVATHVAMLAAAFSLAQNTPVARDRSVFSHGYECVIASPDADEWNVTPRGTRLISAPANSLDQEGQIYEARTDAVTQTSGDSYSMDFHGARMLACRPVPGHSVPRDEL